MWPTQGKKLSQQAHAMGFLPMMVTLVSLFFGLGCSAGALMVQVPTPTPTPHKTVQPTFTITPFPTATFTPTPTPPPTFTPTPTATPMPTATPLPQDTAAPPPPPAQAAAPAPAPAEPQAPPTPSEPTPTPTPAFPFNVVYATHNTGSPGETRFTAWVRVDHRPGEFKTLANFQMKVLAPDGNTYLSEPSGSGFADSTMAGTGDNHWMNTKLEIRPYSPGVYKIYLVEGEVQVSPETEITLSTDPLQYIHFDFFKSEPK